MPTVHDESRLCRLKLMFENNVRRNNSISVLTPYTRNTLAVHGHDTESEIRISTEVCH
jgi:hypothetical protein